ncbi:GRIP and coiled-coil domain-containing protein 1 [Lucilia sericata]|uniref:GRIP and coiled-coil domain-containing protein 1 n=1 Tax=Lucilia sericata TaxID=13632 RepID=UPI0018A7FD91|nr:GRIP and coiled-coil domain-containing protein 1 [Lucilia sericata]
MERSRNDLESIINSQKEQLSRYEKRLKDIITAYKGLLKEKEALETSLTAILNKNDDKNLEPSPGNAGDSNVEQSNELQSSSKSEGGTDTDDKFSLQSQIATLMNSLATLSAEKSRMEASFQADKKVLRAQLQQKDEIMNELRNTIKKNEELAKADVDEFKAKLIIERQEREKETNNQMLMIRELQKLYADERHLKENIEMQLNNFKMQFASNEAENTRITELQAQLKEAKAQIKLLNGQRSGTDPSSSAAQNSSVLLQQLQKEMQQLKEHHAIAIKNEQHRVQLAEEQSRKLAVLHESRVANLESRLAELSTSVGTYDRLRQQDQESIQLLKMQIHDLEKMTSEHSNKTQLEGPLHDLYTDNRIKRAIPTNNDISNIIENIMYLKKILLQANTHSPNPIDLTNIFSVGADHSQCEEEIARASQQLEASKREVVELEKKLNQQKDHITTLQEKVKDLNRNIDEQDLELKNYNEKLRVAVKEERSKWQTLHADTENDYRCKLNDLEQQLQKQRQRSLQLLDEKEQEIKALQTSFEIFHSTNQSNIGTSTLNVAKNDTNNATSSDGETLDDVVQDQQSTYKKTNIKAKKLSMGDSCHMLHYANEIARKDIEIANLRKAKYQAETSMRKAIHEKVTAQEELNNKIESLEEQVDRLERCKSREGANLEYLKNVIISYIVSKDTDGKRHMMNAISAVLQFTPQETKVINEAFNKK